MMLLLRHYKPMFHLKEMGDVSLLTTRLGKLRLSTPLSHNYGDVRPVAGHRAVNAAMSVQTRHITLGDAAAW